MKDTVINIRISETLKYDLTLACELERISISRFGRIALEEKLAAITKEVSKIPGLENDGGEDLLQIFGFSEFIFWIYEKKRNPEKSESKEYYNKHLKLIEKMMKHPLFTEDVLIEIDKIKIELEGVLSGEMEKYSDFAFASKENMDSFDYILFADFMFNLRGDDQGGKKCHLLNSHGVH